MGFLDERPVAKIVAAIIVVAPLITLLTGTVPAENASIVESLIFLGGGFLFGTVVANKV